VVLPGNAGSLRRGLRGAEAPLFHGCAGVRGGIPEQRLSGAEARIRATVIAALKSAAPPKSCSVQGRVVRRG
jgi:hypothetical protein